MKSSKSTKVVYAVLIALTAITVSSYGIATKSSVAASKGLGVPKLENINGKAEFYFTPSDDGRIWHVVNKYNAAGSNSKGYNEATYIFSSDSVYVINEYAGITPGNDELDIALVHSLNNENNFNNQ